MGPGKNEQKLVFVCFSLPFLTKLTKKLKSVKNEQKNGETEQKPNKIFVLGIYDNIIY
jgi:hypothetical protein